MDGMRESDKSFERALAQGYQPAPAPAPRACRRAARVAGTWLLAWLVLAAGGLRAETGAGGLGILTDAIDKVRAFMGMEAGDLRILMLGDSLTAGYGLASGDALPVRLEAALRHRGLGVEVINAGVSGDTTAGGLARLQWALAARPHAVIVALGANDALRAVDPAVTHSNLDRMLAALAERRLPALLAGMLAPRNLGPDYIARFDAIYPQLASRHGTLLYPFLLDGVATVAALNQADGVHPNVAGVEVIVERMLPSVLCLVHRADHPVARAARATGEEADCPVDH